MVESETAAYSVTRFPTLLACCRALPPLKIPCGTLAVQKQEAESRLSHFPICSIHPHGNICKYTAACENLPVQFCHFIWGMFWTIFDIIFNRPPS